MDIDGYCHPRFESVKQAFAQNWELFDEVGASVAITVEGQPVVDLWGGWVDGARTRPWERDTIVLVASTTKGWTGLCGNMLIERGLLDPEAPVTKYWPEFGANGKQNVPVKYLFDHRVGLPDIPAGAAIHDWDAMTSGLAAAAPNWEPGTAHAYHSITYGNLVGELIRRVSGVSPGTFLQREVCGPLGAQAWLGVPPEQQGNIAELVGSAAPFTNPEWVEAEVPAAGGHANARGLARIYGVLGCGGELDGVHLLNRSTIEAALDSPATGRWFGWSSEMLAAVGVSESLFTLRFGRGFALNSEFAYMGPNRNAFGYGGSGGSFAFGDLDAKVGFGYAQNAHLGQGAERHSRSGRLIEALYSAL